MLTASEQQEDSMGKFTEYYRRALPMPIRQAIGSARQWRPVIDLGIGARNAVFLAGGTRTGSGWVANIINYNNEYRYMYEPFTPRNTPICKAFTLSLYLRPDNRNPLYLEPAKAILNGTVRHNHGMHQFNTRLFSNKRLIKEVRAHLWLKWLRVNFPETPIVLLMRHPCATVNSRMKRLNVPLYDEFVNQRELIEDCLAPYWSEIEGAEDRSEFEQRIFAWCIQQFVPLSQLAPGEVLVTFYENFAAKPHEEIGRLFKYLRKKFDDRVLEALEKPSQAIMVPSQVTRKNAAILTGSSVTDSWRDDVTKEQTRKAIEILRIFGLDAIYSEESMPHAEGVAKFRDRNSRVAVRCLPPTSEA
jgi:hypothetical protein